MLGCLLLVLPLCKGHSMAYLSEMMERNGYQMSDQPGKPVFVQTDVFVASIGPVSEVDFTYEVFFLLRHWWVDERLTWNATDKSIHTAAYTPDILWTPDTYVVNAREIFPLNRITRTVINSTGGVYLSRRYRAICQCDMKLDDFPIDVQDCHFLLESYAHNESSMRYEWLRPNASDWSILGETEEELNEKKSLIAYSVIDVKLNATITVYGVGANSENYTNLRVSFTLERKLKYYLVKVYIPSAILIGANTCGYWLPDNAIPARIALLTATFLANILTLQSITDQTARTSGITALQSFLMVNLIFLIIATAEFVVIVQWRRIIQKREYKKHFHDTQSYNLPSHHQNNVDDEETAADFPPTHLLDRVARVAVPLLYVAYCAGYWLHYAPQVHRKIYDKY